MHLDNHLQRIFDRAMESARRAGEDRRADPAPETKQGIKQIWQLSIRRLPSAKYRLVILLVMADDSLSYREGELDEEQTIRFFEKNSLPPGLPQADNQVVYIIENGRMTKCGMKGAVMDDLLGSD
jgi:hypothetical protein